ncbi:MAG: NUDIX hydrolase [Clostridia bacterium]|nr:NUDIX hydrolase [Clostridia bacterium]
MKTIKQTDNRFLNMYETDFTDRDGREGKYFFASRARDEHSLKCNCGEGVDGVDIVAVYEGKLVLIKQYRVPVDREIYECPAGLVDAGEDARTAAVREFHEETGLTLSPIDTPEGWERGFYTSVGMSDEACATVYGHAHGRISDEFLEAAERITVVLADREEAARILREEPLSMRCALALMQFVGGGLAQLL